MRHFTTVTVNFKDADFDESQHPRAHGKFAKVSSGKSRSAVSFDKYGHQGNKSAPDRSGYVKWGDDVAHIKNELKNQGRLNGNAVDIYHVTTPDRVASIKQHGLIPSHSEAIGQEWAAEHSKHSIYFHTDKKIAEDQARQSGGSVITARVPITPKTLTRFLPDEDFTDNDHPDEGINLLLHKGPVAFIGGVPSHAIVHSENH